MSANVSALQKARAQYQPKLPTVLPENGTKVKPVEGEPTESGADQASNKGIFDNTYGLPVLTFEAE